jgi:GT2 family glycosyltransferase
MTSGLHAVVEDVSVVIPTIGRPLLTECLDSIAAGTVWPYEIIVVDQGTGDETAAWIDRLRATGVRAVHVRSQERGIAAATNRGLERVHTVFAALTHDDCLVSRDWLEKASARVRELEEAVLTGRVEAKGDGVVLTVVTAPEPAVYTEPLVDRDVLFPANMVLSTRVLDRVGYFDEHPSLWLAGEDNEWAYRALRCGVSIVYDPGIVVAHVAWLKREDLLRIHRRYARGQGSFYGKYLRQGDRFIVRRTIRQLLRAPWLLLRGIINRNPNLVAMGFGEVTGLLPGIVSGIQRR